jgi:hypothetical protein
MKFMEWVGPKTNVFLMGGLLVGMPPYKCSDPGGVGGSAGSSSAGEQAGGTASGAASEGGGGGSTAAGSGTAAGSETGGTTAGGSETGGTGIGSSETGGTAAAGSETGGTATGGSETGGTAADGGTDSSGTTGGTAAGGGGAATGGTAGGSSAPTFPGMGSGFDTSNPGAIKDNHTGLVWQQLADGSYPFLNWDSAVAYCSELEHAGLDDWRLPTAYEMFTLFPVDYVGSNYQDLTVFPNSPAGQYWTYTNADYWGEGWHYIMYLGAFLPNMSIQPVMADVPEFEQYVRCVRGGYATSPRSTELGDHTLLDNQTGLVWEQLLSWDLTFSEATDRCASLPGGTWRLPTVAELVDALAANYPYDFEVDPFGGPNWTSTPVAQPVGGRWIVYNLDTIPVGEWSLPATAPSRCVRNGW